MKTFTQYLYLREESDGGDDSKNDEKKDRPSITSKIKLQKKEGSNEFAPFTVNKTTHPNLRLLIKAFDDSDNVGLGYTTIEKSKGEIEPVLKRKQLWLTGGAVRDHLRGKTPRNYDLVTDATTSEIRMILTQSEQKFTEVKPKDEQYSKDQRYSDLPQGNKNKSFYASRWDKTGKEIEMTVEINEEKFELATLSRHCKSRQIAPEKGQSATSVEEDSTNRDFTFNAMYIPLTQSDGDNSELIDPHGGAHHLKNGEVIFVGNAAEKLKADPSTSLRYVKMVSRFGNPDKIPDKYKSVIEKHKDLQDVDKNHIRKEFVSGLEHPDVDAKKYLKTYKGLGLINTIFPDIDFDENMPPDFKGDRWLAPAWILKNNDPEEVKKILDAGGWSKQEANDIAYLVHLAHWANKKSFDADTMYDLKQKHTGLTKNKIREWMEIIGKTGEHLDAFLNHDDKDLSKMIDGPEGKKQVNPMFIQHLGRMPKPHELEDVKKTLSKNRWSDMLNKLKHKTALIPQNQFTTNLF